MENKNWALLVKWWWRFGEEEALWRKIISGKYGENKWGWESKPGPRYTKSSIWGVVASFVEVSNIRREVFFKGVGFLVGEGREVSFRFHDWVGAGPLRVLFPRVFSVVSSRKSSTGDC